MIRTIALVATLATSLLGCGRSSDSDSQTLNGGAALPDVAGNCQSAADCGGTLIAVASCAAGPGGTNWSCINARCLGECSSPRACTFDGTVQQCGGQRRSVGNCSSPRRLDPVVEDFACLPGASFPWATGQRISAPKQRDFCTFEVGDLGRLQWLDDRTMIGTLTTLGGECTGVAYVGAAGEDRWVVSCPNCQFVLQF